MPSFLEEAEQNELFRQKSTGNSELMFASKGSAGNNPLRLAQIITAFDFAMNLLNWQNKPLAHLTNFLVSYQASIDTKYHSDFKDVLVAEEIERKRAERKGISIMSQ